MERCDSFCEWNSFSFDSIRNNANRFSFYLLCPIKSFCNCIQIMSVNDQNFKSKCLHFFFDRTNVKTLFRFTGRL